MIWTLLRMYVYGMFTAFGLYNSCLFEVMGTIGMSALHLLLLLVMRPHSDKIGGFFEILTCTAEIALLLAFMLDYHGGVDVPIGLLIGITVLIVGGQVALTLQVCCCRRRRRRRRRHCVHVGRSGAPLSRTTTGMFTCLHVYMRSCRQSVE